jgi:transposase
MNSSSDAVASRHGESKTVPERRFRRRMGLCCPLSSAGPRRCSAAQSRASGGLQRTEVDRAHRLCLALYATRLAYTREATYQQTRRWLEAGVFEEMVHDLRVLLRLSEGRAPDPTATILDCRTLQSTPESGSRGGYDGHKHKKGSKVHAAVDTLGHLLALFVTPASEQERARVGELAVPIYREREVTGIAQDDTGVDVEVSDGQSLRAEYLVGCDGGRSLIHKAAGIDFPGGIRQ